MSKRRATSPDATECRRMGSRTLAGGGKPSLKWLVSLSFSGYQRAITFHRRYKLHISVCVGGDDFVEGV